MKELVANELCCIRSSRITREANMNTLVVPLNINTENMGIELNYVHRAWGLVILIPSFGNVIMHEKHDI